LGSLLHHHYRYGLCCRHYRLRRHHHYNRWNWLFQHRPSAALAVCLTTNETAKGTGAVGLIVDLIGSRLDQSYCYHFCRHRCGHCCCCGFAMRIIDEKRCQHRDGYSMNVHANISKALSAAVAAHA
jgi:hypothetical protein